MPFETNRMRVTALWLALLSMMFQPEASLAERSIFDCSATRPEVEIHKALELVQGHLAKHWAQQKNWSIEAAILQCRDQRKFWEVHARAQPHTGKKLVLHVQMDAIVTEAGVISDG